MGRPSDETRAKLANLYRGARVAYDLIFAAAERGLPCPTNETISAAIGAQSLSSAANAVNALMFAGLIEVKRGGSNRVVTVVETGKATAGEVKAPHWRERGLLVPSAEDAPPIAAGPTQVAGGDEAVRSREPDLSDQIDVEALRLGIPRDELLARLIWLGWECHLDEQPQAPTVSDEARRRAARILNRRAA